MVHSIKSLQVDCCHLKNNNQKLGNPNNNEGSDQVEKKEDNNKQQDNANPTMREMNMIQVDCCK